MHPRVEQLPPPSPDYRRFSQVLQRGCPDRVPLIELAVHPKVVDTLLDESAPAGDVRTTVERSVRMHHRLGYDVVKVSAFIPWGVARLAGKDQSELTRGDDDRQWANEHDGPIGSMDDFKRFRWPEATDADFTPVETAIEALPEGMGLIGFSGGVLEFTMELIGMERFMIASLADPDLVANVIDRVGLAIHNVFEAYCRLEPIRAIWLGDDLGHKHGLLVSPRLLETHVFPWYRRFADLAHAHNRPFMLHTCGKTDLIIPTLVDQIGIDAKHSFEDGIQPVEEFYDLWHECIAVLGGVDVHILAAGNAREVRRRTLDILNHTAGCGGYACGSGNSIPNYVSPENYLTMIEAAADFNGLR